MPNVFGEGTPDATGMRVAIVAAIFNDQFTKRLCNGAVTTAREHGVADEAIDVYWVPGAFEIPLMAGELAAAGLYDAIACVGAVVRGETPHFDFVAGEAARGIMEIGRESGVPVGFGVITANTLEQAEARSGGSVGNTGSEAMYAALHVASLLRELTTEDEEDEG
ncbi:MAG: 6,7-dimethyl-8-ribityllumazine synthase [Chloroflexi bacterium]|nr:6,7-dimethyl-8-ribityllumazine synthase [Chloroflexota bacterium]